MIQILFSILVCAVYIYLFYFKTDFGYGHWYMPVTGVPCWFSSILFCVLSPFITYYSVEEYNSK